MALQGTELQEYTRITHNRILISAAFWQQISPSFQYLQILHTVEGKHSTFKFPVSKISLWRNLYNSNYKKHPATFQRRWNPNTPALTLQTKIVTAVIWQSVQHSNLHKAALCNQPDLQVSSHTLHAGAETFQKCDNNQRRMWIWQNTIPCFLF